jgi:phage terminase large subunit-like protein
VAGAWNRAFLDEHEQFPVGTHDDQVDAASGAFNKLAEAIGTYDRSLAWVG